MIWKMYLLSNMVILCIYVKFRRGNGRDGFGDTVLFWNHEVSTYLAIFFWIPTNPKHYPPQKLTTLAQHFYGKKLANENQTNVINHRPRKIWALPGWQVNLFSLAKPLDGGFLKSLPNATFSPQKIRPYLGDYWRTMMGKPLNSQDSQNKKNAKSFRYQKWRYESTYWGGGVPLREPYPYSLYRWVPPF